jgi:phosphate transport system protein
MATRAHIDRHYDEELRELRHLVLEMGGFVERQIADAMRALVERDEEFARLIIERDKTVNRMDVQIDDICLRLLALHQPAGRDLRLITTALKITTDLERAGDMAENIAERAIELSREPQLKPLIDLPRMATIAQGMLRQALDAFVREDSDMALQVCHQDDAVDALTDQLLRELLTFMMESPQTISRALRLIFVSKYIERLADHATNIAEMVVFMVKGKSIRHLDRPPSSL